MRRTSPRNRQGACYADRSLRCSRDAVGCPDAEKIDESASEFRVSGSKRNQLRFESRQLISGVTRVSTIIGRALVDPGPAGLMP